MAKLHQQTTYLLRGVQFLSDGVIRLLNLSLYLAVSLLLSGARLVSCRTIKIRR